MYRFIILFSLIAVYLQSENRFKIEVPQNSEEYELIQSEMRKIDMDTVFESASVTKSYPFLRNRVEVGKFLQLIDKEQGFYPEQQLIKVGKGGERCIVTYASFNRNYADLIRSITKELESVGYNGYFYYRIGGYPTPTGVEAQYAAVPYAFKIFMMLEAAKLAGINNILWIDAALLPLRNPEPLFEKLNQDGHFLNVLYNAESFQKAIPLSTRVLLTEYSGHDYLTQDKCHINMTVFGLCMDRPLAKNFLKSYYELVENGNAFISCLPEEYVISSIINQPKHRLTSEILSIPLMIRVREENSQSIEKQRKKGYFFLSRSH